MLTSWELACLFGLRGLATPLATLLRLTTFATSGDLWHHTQYTLAAAASGFVLGAVPGLLLPVVIRRHDTVKRVLAPFVAAAYGAPKVALAPVLVLWFGIGLGSKVVLVASIVFFVVFFLTNAGLERVSDALIQAARVMGANERWIAREILWPGAAPYILAAIRVAVPQAIGGAVVGELISSNRGLGYVIQSSATDFDAAGVFTGVTVLTLIVVGLSAVLDRAERRALSWRPPSAVAESARATL